MINSEAGKCSQRAGKNSLHCCLTEKSARMLTTSLSQLSSADGSALVRDQFFVIWGHLEETQHQIEDCTAITGRCNFHLPESWRRSNSHKWGKAGLRGKVTRMAKAANRAPMQVPTGWDPKRTRMCTVSLLSRVKSWACTVTVRQRTLFLSYPRQNSVHPLQISVSSCSDSSLPVSASLHRSVCVCVCVRAHRCVEILTFPCKISAWG